MRLMDPPNIKVMTGVQKRCPPEPLCNSCNSWHVFYFLRNQRVTASLMGV